MLTDLAASAELFHTADGTAFADLMIDGHRETWPVRSGRLRSCLRSYETTDDAPGAGPVSSAINLLKHGRSLTRPGGPFISASGKMTVEFFWILLTTVGALLRSDPTAGK